MFTPSSASSYPTYTPLPGMPSKAGTVGSEPRLREIRRVSDTSDARDDWESGRRYGDVPDKCADDCDVARPHPAQRYNAPIYSPQQGVGWPSNSQSTSDVPPLWHALSQSPAQAPHVRPHMERIDPFAALSAPQPPSHGSRSPLVYGTGPARQQASPSRPQARPADAAQRGSTTNSSADMTATRLHLVAAECEDLLSTLRQGSGSPNPLYSGRQSLPADAYSRNAESPTRAQMGAASRHPGASGLPPSHVHHLKSDGDENEDVNVLEDSPSNARRGYLHEARAALTGTRGRSPSGWVATPRQSSEIFGLEDDSHATYNALMGALQDLTAAHQRQTSPRHEDGSESSTVCVAPPDLAPELDTPADLIAPLSLKWMLFLVQRRERQLMKADAAQGGTAQGLSEHDRLVLKMATTLREALSYLQSVFGTTLTRTKAQQLNQLMLYVSNLVSRFAQEDDRLQQAHKQSRATQSALREELERAVDTLEAVLAEKESASETLTSTQSALHALQQQLDTVQSEKDALINHYDRVAADNAELLARLQEAEEKAKSAAETARQVDRKREKGNSDKEGSQSTTSTERRCAVDAMKEEYDRLQALMNRQTSTMRDLRGDLDAVESENDHLRGVIGQLRQSLVRHRTVVELLTRRKMDGGVGLTEPSPQLIDNILSGAKAVDDSDLETEDSVDYR